MRLRSFIAALGALMLFACVTFAAFCPRCNQTLREDQKFCDSCSARIAAEENLAATEAEFVEQMRINREAYLDSLGQLRDFYLMQGDHQNYEKVVNELQDLGIARQYFYQHWEDTLTGISPSKRIREAELLYEQADRLRKSVNPFTIRRRQLMMIDLYRRILQEYPDSDLVDETAYRLGQVYEELGGPEMRRAARFYERCFSWNPSTELPARFRAAKIYDERLRDYNEAIRLYRLAMAAEKDDNLRREAALRLDQLERMKAAGELAL